MCRLSIVDGFRITNTPESVFNSSTNRAITLTILDDVQSLYGNTLSKHEVMQVYRTYHKSLKDRVTRIASGKDSIQNVSMNI